MPEDADIPDLKKKAQERGQSGFAWSQDAAPARGTAGGPPTPSLAARVKSAVRGKAATFTILMGTGMGLGLGVFGLAMFEVGEPDPAKGGGLPGLFSSLKVRPGGRDRMRYLVGKTGLFPGLAKGAKGEAEEVIDAAAEQAAAEAEAAAVSGGEAGDDPASPPAGPRATNSGAYMGGATAAASLGGGPGSRGSSAGGAAPPQFNPAAGRADTKGSKKVRRSRGTLGITDNRRGLAGGPPASGRTVATGAASSRGAGAQGSAATAPSGLDLVRGGSDTGAAPAPAAGSSAEGAEGGGSSPDGGGPGGGPEDAEDPDKVLKTIQGLLDKATAEGKKAEKEKKIAAALALAGQHPQAAYHYMRGEKAEKKSKEYAAQAQKMATVIGAGAETAPPQSQP
ncbi:MAG: hypothetical protein HYV15_03425 [Elusimicrobia bacterium]|nr:hypothetical protein [Elusimicrobiota bacterium]